MKRLVTKYPHIALGSCGICCFITPVIVAGNLKLIDEYLQWRLPRWAMLALLVIHIVAVVIGAVVIGAAILWGLDRRRSTK